MEFLGGIENSERKTDLQTVAQRQEMVSGTLALLSGLLGVAFYVSRASAPKSCRTQGESVRPYVLCQGSQSLGQAF